jgi:glycosyltransferase involved in cell wall biosynthesis
MTKVLVYYFAFPHYRLEILKELMLRAGNDLMVAGGTVGRDSIEPLTSQDIDFLTELESVHIGPFSWQKGIVRRAISREFDAVVLGPATLSLTTWAILFGRRLMGRKTYLWGQCGRQGERTAKRYLQEVMNRVAHGLLVYGETEAAAATDLGSSPRKIHIVNNATHHNAQYITPELGREIYQRLQQRAREAIDDRRLVLTFVGRLTEAKKLPVLLEAARRLQLQYEHLQVRVIGGGSAEEQLRREYSDPFVEFRGWIYDNEKLNEVLEESTLIASPYHMGLLAVDALRIGVPVLVPDNPQNGSEVESLTVEVNSIRFTPGDSVAIVDAVDRWLRIAPQITETKYAQARDSALRMWSPGSVAGRILDVIKYES